MLCGVMGNFRSRLLLRPVLTLEMIAVLFVVDGVQRQPVGIEQLADVLTGFEHDLLNVVGLMDRAVTCCNCL
jgi:hypothetical protein